jgi:hypothetical protein
MARSSVKDRVVSRVRETVEDYTGVTVADVKEVGALRESAVQLEMWREEAMELAYWAMDYFSGRPQEMRPERRNRLAQRSRIAQMQDPLAGAEAQLLANFSFGRGIGRPQAIHPAVQAVIDEAWENPVNLEKLTSYEAQRHRSNEMIAQANLYPTAFVRNGKVRVGFLDADQVPHIVCDPEDDERPLWFVTRKYEVGWDFESDRPLAASAMGGKGGSFMTPQIVYYPHWQNVTDAMRERVKNGEEELELPPAKKIGGGYVAHFRINRIGRTQYGTPPWARTLRFYSAMNSLTEAHVAMAQARSSFIAKRVSKGTPEQIQRMANSMLSMGGEIGAARFGENPGMMDGPTGFGGGFGPEAGFDPRFSPPMAGSVWHENESSTLTSLQLSSGASEAEQSAQVVRAPIAGAAQFGQHYFGDASNGNLASNTSLELPALMNVQAWQQTFEDLLRWFTDMAIEAAVRNGDLGGQATPDEDEEDDIRFEVPDISDPSLAEGEDAKDPEQVLREWEDETYRRTRARLRAGERRKMPLHTLRLREDQQEIERRTGIDLSYTFTMPYPGRRNLPDVLAAVNTVALSYDPMGQNIPLRRSLLLFLASQGLEVDDPARWVDEVLPKNTKPPPMMPGAPPGVAAQALAPQLRPERQIGDPKKDASQSFNALGRMSPNDEMGEAMVYALGGPAGVERLRESYAMQQVGAALARLSENRWDQPAVDRAVEDLLAPAATPANGNGASGGSGE